MRIRVRSVVLAAAADAACVLTFATVGRASHAGSGATAEVLRIAWPFLVGGALAWAATRAWRAPRQVWPRGVAVWALTWAAGMAVRGAAGGGLAPTFLLVAAASLGVLLLGWRAIAALVSGGRRAARPRPASSRPGAAAR